ncbi:MAG TPA: TonB-dependent receptor [Caulobacteraceae bacterium]
MTVNKMRLVGSASGIALLCAAAPAFAQATSQDAAPAYVTPAAKAAAEKAAAAGDTGGEVVVTGIRASLQKAIEIKKLAIDQVDAISATDIGKLPDKNAADALQRIVGVNTESAASGEGGFDENDRVSIRGTSPSLTQVTIDGHNVATGDWFILDQYQTVGRSVSFTLLPAELVDTAEVYKTQDASLLEGGVAGVVNLVTRRPLDFTQGLTVQGSAEAAYNSLSQQTKPQVDALINWKSPDDKFGILAQGFYEDRSIERFGQETLGYTAITSAMPIGAAHPSLVGVEAPTLIGSTLFQQEKTREGGELAAEWRPNDRVELNLSGFYSHLTASNVNDNYMYWGTNELNNNVPTSFTVAHNTLTSAVWPAGPDGLVVDNITRPNENAYSYYVNLDGKFKVTDALTIKTQIGYTQGQGNTPSQPSFEVDGGSAGISYAPSGNGWVVNPVGVNTQSPAGLSNDWAWNAIFHSLDTEYYGKFDGDYAVGDGVFKDVLFGFHASDHTRRVDGWDRGCTLGANGACFGSPTMPFSATDPVPYPSGYNAGALGIPGLLLPIAGNKNVIASIINAIPGGVRGPVSAIHTPQNYYWLAAFKVHEDDYAGYVMAKVGGDGWRGNFGLRIVDTDENAFVNVPTSTANPAVITSSAFGPYFIDHVKHNYVDFLPSINLTFDLQKNLFLRLSAAETMSRPDYSALGGTVSLTDLTLTGNGGNPDLKPVKAAVYDGALEWYYAPSSIATVSLFYDDLQSYVAFGTHTGVFLDQLLSKPGSPPVFKPYNISSPVNSSGQLTGVELQVQQPLAYGFGFQANFTYVDGHDQNGGSLVGTSRITYNLVGYYENSWVSARLAYTYRSAYLVGLDRSSLENEAGNGQLDASVNFNVTHNVTLSVDALNLTNSLLKYYSANPTQVRAVYNNGTQVYAGVHVKF